MRGCKHMERSCKGSIAALSNNNKAPPSSSRVMANPLCTYVGLCPLEVTSNPHTLQGWEDVSKNINTGRAIDIRIDGV